MVTGLWLPPYVQKKRGVLAGSVWSRQLFRCRLHHLHAVLRQTALQCVGSRVEANSGGHLRHEDMEHLAMMERLSLPCDVRLAWEVHGTALAHMDGAAGLGGRRGFGVAHGSWLAAWAQAGSAARLKDSSDSSGKKLPVAAQRSEVDL